MNNEQLIANAGVMSGAMSQEEVQRYIDNGEEIPLHTYAGWKLRGRIVKKGEHGIETRLWKRKTRKNRDADEIDGNSSDEDTKQGFCLVMSYLFREDQTIPAGQEDE